MTRTRRRDTKKWLREHDEARQRLATFIMAHGGADSPNWYDWRLPTTLGDLYVSMHDSDETIYTRFAEPVRARTAGIFCNPHTGKWNFHPYSGSRVPGDDHAIVFESFAAHIGRFLIPGINPIDNPANVV